MTPTSRREVRYRASGLVLGAERKCLARLASGSYPRHSGKHMFVASFSLADPKRSLPLFRQYAQKSRRLCGKSGWADSSAAFGVAELRMTHISGFERSQLLSPSKTSRCVVDCPSLKPGMKPGKYLLRAGVPQGKTLFRDFQIDFVQVPSRMGFGSAFAQVRCDHRPEMVHPAPDGLIAEHDPAFRQQIFDHRI